LKLKIISEEDDKLEMAVGGEGHTLLNLLSSVLLVNQDVKMAGYSKPHPLMDRSLLYVRMKENKDYRDTLLRAAEDAKGKVNEFLTQFKNQASKRSD
jgi:DNA-directed RNA polymerase subunit L